MALLLALTGSGIAGCGGAATPVALPVGHPTGVAMLPTGEPACASERAACHASGAEPPPEIATARATGAPPLPETVTAPAATAEASSPTAPAVNSAESREANEDGEYIKVEWGSEVTFDEMLEMGKRGEIAEIEWYALPNAIRLITVDRKIFNVQNAKYGRSAKKELEAVGVKIGKGGIPMNYYFCN